MSVDTKMARTLADMVGTRGLVMSDEERRRVYSALRELADAVDWLRGQSLDEMDGRIELRERIDIVIESAKRAAAEYKKLDSAIVKYEKNCT